MTRVGVELDEGLLTRLVEHQVSRVSSAAVWCTCGWLGKRDQFLEHNPFLVEAIRVGRENVLRELEADALALAREVQQIAIGLSAGMLRIKEWARDHRR